VSLIVVRNSKNQIVANKVSIAATFFKRARGLLLSSALNEGAGLWITPCNSVHTFFMSYPIDVVFLDRDLRVVSIIENMVPGKISRIQTQAHSVLELPAGTVKKQLVTVGEQLIFEPAG
jgi:uncharacterized membrane protein (UPF0127 family)